MEELDRPYLRDLPASERQTLAEINRQGLAKLRELLSSGEAIAFLGAGVSTPLYPLWMQVISEIIDAADHRLTEPEKTTFRALAAESPDAVVDIVRRRLGPPVYHETLRKIFNVRRDPATDRTWTALQELIVRCDFRGIVTTNYDPGVLDARMRARPHASSTGFATWSNELALDRWRSGDIFDGCDELPVLFAHGHHNQPEEIVLATTEYRRAYEGKLANVLSSLCTSGHLVWIGFSFADQRIAAILREIIAESGTRMDPGMTPRHVALMPWCRASDGAASYDPGTLREICEIQYGAEPVLYPVDGEDHTSLRLLLEEFLDARYEPIPEDPSKAGSAPDRGLRAADAAAATDAAESGESAAAETVVHWEHGGEPIEHFSGRHEELARLGRWAADPTVRLIGVTAWGGAGKTGLVTEWLVRRGGTAESRKPDGVFGWSFYENPSGEEWAQSLLDWAAETFGFTADSGRLSDRVLALVERVSLVLVLDGLEVLQEGPSGHNYGRLLAGILRDALTSMCRCEHRALVVLTSRFPFADLERFDGSAARMLDVPPLTVAEGSELLAKAGAAWIDENEREGLVRAAEGHALAIGALAGALSTRPPSDEVEDLVDRLEAAGRTDERLRGVLAFYAETLGHRDRALVGIVSLFQRPIKVEWVLSLGASPVLDGVLAGWSASDVRAAVEQRLSGLLSWHADSTMSAHPLVREGFRHLALTPESAQLVARLTLDDLPAGRVRTRQEVVSVVEVIELLLNADQWQAADELYMTRTAGGGVWKWIPAGRLGQRCTLAFVGTPERRSMCEIGLGSRAMGAYLNNVAYLSTAVGDMTTAEEYLQFAIEHHEANEEELALHMGLCNQASNLRWQGVTDSARDAAERGLVLAENLRKADRTMVARSILADIHSLVGEVQAAEREFLAAARAEYEREGLHLYSRRGFGWAQFLLRTGRTDIARRLAESNLEISRSWGWNEDSARAEWILGLCDLDEDLLGPSAKHLTAAATTFRDGDYLCELGMVLVFLAEQQRRSGDLAGALRTCSEAIEIASPRRLIPTQAHALSVRARIRADLIDSGSGDVHAARDDGEHSLRLATRIKRLAWQELDALRALAYIDRIEGVDHGWAARSREIERALCPAGLDPDVLATIEATTEPGVTEPASGTT